METQEKGQSGALALDAWLANVSQTICWAVEQRSDDTNVEMQQRVKCALRRTGVIALREKTENQAARIRVLEGPTNHAGGLDSLRDMVRIVEAMRFTTGLGKNQVERLERAKAILANTEVGNGSAKKNT